MELLKYRKSGLVLTTKNALIHAKSQCVAMEEKAKGVEHWDFPLRRPTPVLCGFLKVTLEHFSLSKKTLDWGPIPPRGQYKNQSMSIIKYLKIPLVRSPSPRTQGARSTMVGVTNFRWLTDAAEMLKELKYPSEFSHKDLVHGGVSPRSGATNCSGRSPVMASSSVLLSTNEHLRTSQPNEFQRKKTLGGVFDPWCAQSLKPIFKGGF